MNYYNEIDPFAVEWLYNLIAAGLIPPGIVDDRSIEDVHAEDLEGFTQCHFFAGIGGWPLALSLVEWPEDLPVWTGSCPCQPFSTAGRRRGDSDKRHLWPVFGSLIGECQPSIVFGEQVASPAGRKWLGGVRLALEAVGYAVGAADLCAAGVGAPHIRQRLYWVAESSGERRERQRLHVQPRRPHEALSQTGRGGEGSSNGLGDAGRAGAGRDARTVPLAETLRERERQHPWNLADCTVSTGADGKTRRIKSGLEPLANGVPGRVGKLRSYGNAIVPQVAAEFIRAYMETEV
jgi:DNA (cytosine-5)-methyltransferase 1